MIRINLLPVREARRRADVQQQLLLFALVIGVAVLGVGYMHFSIRSDIGEAERRVQQTQAQIKKYDAQLQQVEDYKVKKAAVQKKLDVIHGLDRSRSGPVHVLDELSTHTQDRMWLTTLSVKDRRLKLDGMSLDNEIIAVFLTELNNSPYFTEVELTSTELESAQGLKLNHFEVSALITDPGAKKDEAEDGTKAKKDKGKRARKSSGSSAGR